MCVESFEVYSYYVQCGFSIIFIHTSICVYIGIFGRIHKYIKDMGFNVYNKFHWISLLYVEELENFKNLLTSNKICIFFIPTICIIVDRTECYHCIHIAQKTIS
jgi:hypothetical protein